jgi:hypothetical protein
MHGLQTTCHIHISQITDLSLRILFSCSESSASDHQQQRDISRLHSIILTLQVISELSCPAVSSFPTIDICETYAALCNRNPPFPENVAVKWPPAQSAARVQTMSKSDGCVRQPSVNQLVSTHGTFSAGSWKRLSEN